MTAYGVRQAYRSQLAHAANSTFAIGGVFPLRRDRLCFADSFVVKESSPDSYRDRINISAEKPAHRKPPNR